MNSLRIVLLFLFFSFIQCKKDGSTKRVRAITCDNLVNDLFTASDDCYIEAPNAFTPNGDGLNDRFAIFFKNIRIAKLTLFDSHANLVFQTEDLARQWDPYPASVTGQTYFYRIEATSTSNKRIGHCGEVSPLKCIPKNINNNKYYFQSQWDGNSFNLTAASSEYIFCP
jgi:gliding motility-associated-like protein